MIDRFHLMNLLLRLYLLTLSLGDGLHLLTLPLRLDILGGEGHSWVSRLVIGIHRD